MGPHGIEGVNKQPNLGDVPTITMVIFNVPYPYVSVTSWDDPPSTYWVEGVDPRDEKYGEKLFDSKIIQV